MTGPVYHLLWVAYLNTSLAIVRTRGTWWWLMTTTWKLAAHIIAYALLVFIVSCAVSGFPLSWNQTSGGRREGHGCLVWFRTVTRDQATGDLPKTRGMVHERRRRLQHPERSGPSFFGLRSLRLQIVRYDSGTALLASQAPPATVSGR